METSETREQEKRWRNRNSDGILTFERERLQEPPTFVLVETPLPPTPHATTAPEPESDYAAHGIRHVHVWDASLIPPADEDTDAFPAETGFSVNGLLADMGLHVADVRGDGDGHDGHGEGEIGPELRVAGPGPDGDGDGHVLDETGSDVRVMGDD